MDELGDLAFGDFGDDGGGDLGSLLEQLASYSTEYKESNGPTLYDPSDPAAAADDILREHEAQGRGDTPASNHVHEHHWQREPHHAATNNNQNEEVVIPLHTEPPKHVEEELEEITAHASNLVSQVQFAGHVDETRIKDLLNNLGLTYSQEKVDQISHLLMGPPENLMQAQQEELSNTRVPATSPLTPTTTMSTANLSTPPPGYSRLPTVNLSKVAKSAVIPSTIPAYPPPYMHSVAPPAVVSQGVTPLLPGAYPSTWPSNVIPPQPVSMQPLPPGITAPGSSSFAKDPVWDAAARRFEEQLKHKVKSSSRSKKRGRERSGRNKKKRYSSSSSSNSSSNSSGHSSTTTSDARVEIEKKSSKTRVKRKSRTPVPKKRVKRDEKSKVAEKKDHHKEERTKKAVKGKEPVQKRKNDQKSDNSKQKPKIEGPEKKQVKLKEQPSKETKERKNPEEVVIMNKKGGTPEKRVENDVVEIVVKIDHPETIVEKEKPIETAEQKKIREDATSQIANLEIKQKEMESNQSLLAAQMEEVKRRKETNRKRSQILEEQLARLKGEHEEMCRRKHKSRDPLVKKNETLQVEVSKQLEQTRKFTIEMNKALDSAGVRQINGDNDLKHIRRKISQQRDAIEASQMPCKQGSRQVSTKKPSRSQESPVTKTEPQERDKRKMEWNEHGSKEENKRTTLLKPAPARYQYYDAGGHWCSKCNLTTASVLDMLEHIHSNDHRSKLDLYDRPWMDQVSPKESSNQSNLQVQVIPLKGVEFMIPCSAFYCRICDAYAGDTTCGEEHLKSEAHNANYRKHVETDPSYDRRLLLEKAAVLSSRALQNASTKKELGRQANADDLRSVIENNKKESAGKNGQDSEKARKLERDEIDKKNKNIFEEKEVQKTSFKVATAPRMIKADGDTIKIQLNAPVKRVVKNDKAAKQQAHRRSRSRSRSSRRESSRRRERSRSSRRSRSRTSSSSREIRHESRGGRKPPPPRYRTNNNNNNNKFNNRLISRGISMKKPNLAQRRQTEQQIKRAAQNICYQLNQGNNGRNPSKIEVTEAMKKQLMGKATQKDLEMIRKFQESVKLDTQTPKASVKSRLGDKKTEDDFKLELVESEDDTKPLVKY